MANKGDVSVGFILAALMKTGKSVLMPVSYNLRYDLLVDEGDQKYSRIQCKTGRFTDNGAVIAFNACSTNHRGERKDYIGDVDYFGVHCEGKVYLVPAMDTWKTFGWLRVKEPRRKYKGRILWAKDFEIRM